MAAKGGYIYIMSNKIRTVLYIGVCANLAERVFQHKNGTGSVFASKYKCVDLIYFEFFEGIEEAIQREKQLKKWSRAWKENLIKSNNPKLIDLSNKIEDYN